jgi:cation/acetate symporter
MPIAFITIWLVSILDKGPQAEKDRAGYLAQSVRSETGIGADGASGH